MVFPSLPSSGNIVAETKFCFTESKNVSKPIKKHFYCEKMLPSLSTLGNIDPKKSSGFSPSMLYFNSAAGQMMDACMFTIERVEREHLG